MYDTQLEQLFYLQPTATVAVRNGAVLFLNPAAKRLYPDCSTGDDVSLLLPKDVLAFDVSFTCSVNLLEKPCTVIGVPMDDAWVYTILPQENTEMQAALIENVCITMRRALLGGHIATRRLIPAVTKLNDKRQTVNLTALNKSYFQMERICDNLDSFTRLQNGEDVLCPQPTEMVAFCRDLVNTVSHFSKPLGIDFTFQTELAPIVVPIDRQKLTKALINLISNSLKAVSMVENGALQLRLTRRDDNLDNLILSLKDTGCGISPEDVPHIFELYKQKRPTTQANAGTGTGMALAQSILRLHGGNLLLTGTPEEGTTVWLHLPINPAVTADNGQLNDSHLTFDSGANDIEAILTGLSDVLRYEDFSAHYLD